MPYVRTVYTSPLAPQEVLRRLDLNVQPCDSMSFFRWSIPDTTAEFQGEIEGHTFSIRRVIRYRNSFLPVLTGTVHAAPTGSRIIVHMRLSFPVLLFCVAFFTMAAAALSLSLQQGSVALTAGPLPMLVVAFVLITGSFFYEQRKAHRLLLEMFGEKKS